MNNTFIMLRENVIWPELHFLQNVFVLAGDRVAVFTFTFTFIYYILLYNVSSLKSRLQPCSRCVYPFRESRYRDELKLCSVICSID